MALAGLKVGSGRALYVSSAPESAFCTEQTLTHCIVHPLDSEVLEVTTEEIPDTEYSSRNTSDYESSSIKTVTFLQKPLNMYATLEAIGIFLAKCMNGADTKTGTTPTWTHDIANAALPAGLASMTIEDHLSGATGAAATDRKHLGVCVDSFELRIPQQGVARISVGLMGSGRLGTVGTITEAGLVIPSELIEAPKCRLTMEACGSNGTSAWDGTLEVGTTAGVFPTADGSAVDISEYCEEIVIRVLNGCKGSPVFGNSAAAGVNWGRAFPRARRVELEFKAIYGTPFESLLHAAADRTAAAQQEKTFLLNIASDTANRGAMLAFPVCALQAGNPSGLTGPGVQTPTYKFTSRVCALYQPIVAKIADGSSLAYA